MRIDNFLFFVWLLLPLLIWLLNIAIRRRLQYGGQFLIAVFSGYVVYVVGMFLLDAQLESEYMAFDLNSDGNITGDELTPEAEVAQHNLIADAGRATAPIFGFPLTAFWTTICLRPLSMLELWLWPSKSNDVDSGEKPSTK